jgi:hypothetical protein
MVSATQEAVGLREILRLRVVTHQGPGKASHPIEVREPPGEDLLAAARPRAGRSGRQRAEKSLAIPWS